MIFQNLNIILALVIGVLLNVISGWIIVTGRNRANFLLVTGLLVALYIGSEWKKSQKEELFQKEIASQKQQETNTQKQDAPQKPQETKTQKQDTVRLEQDTTTQKAVLAEQKQESQLVIKEKSSTPIKLPAKNESGKIADNQGNLYNILKIGNLYWVVNNLNLDVPESMCYSDDEDNCKLYGRLYSWSSANIACQLLGPGWPPLA